MLRRVYNLDVWEMFVWKKGSRPLLFLKESTQDCHGERSSYTSIFLGSDASEASAVRRAVPQDLVCRRGSITLPVTNLVNDDTGTNIVSMNGQVMTINGRASVNVPSDYTPYTIQHGIIILTTYIGNAEKYYSIDLAEEVQTAVKPFPYGNNATCIYMLSKWYGMASTNYNHNSFLVEQDVVVLEVTSIAEFDDIVASYTKPDFRDEAFQEKIVWSA